MFSQSIQVHQGCALSLSQLKRQNNNFIFPNMRGLRREVQEPLHLQAPVHLLLLRYVNTTQDIWAYLSGSASLRATWRPGLRTGFPHVMAHACSPSTWEGKARRIKGLRTHSAIQRVFKYLFICLFSVSECFSCMYVCTPCACLVPMDVRRGVRPWSRSMDGWAPCGLRELNQGPL